MEPEKKEEEIITIKKSELDSLMERIKRVEAAANKSGLAKYDEKTRKNPSKTVKLRMMDDKVVLSWDNMVDNTVEKNPNGAWFEKQVVKVNYEDETSEELDFSLFSRRFKTLVAEVISKTVENQGTEDEQTILKVKTEDGKEYNINKKFVN